MHNVNNFLQAYLFVIIFCHFSTTCELSCFSRSFMPDSLCGIAISMLMLPTYGSCRTSQSSSESTATKKFPLVFIMDTFTTSLSLTRKFALWVYSAGNLFSQVPIKKKKICFSSVCHSYIYARFTFDIYCTCKNHSCMAIP